MFVAPTKSTVRLTNLIAAKQAAGELECDDDAKAFQDLMGRIVKAKPAKLQPKSQPEKLVEAEHMFEADHDKVAFEKRLKKIAKAKPSTRK